MGERKRKFVCRVMGKVIEGWGGTGMDETRCTFANFAVTLDKIYFGYLCMFLLIIISVISIFGKIKANYRFFILNQTIWDIVLTFNYIDFNSVKSLASDDSGLYQGFLFRYFENLLPLPSIISELLETQPYSALLLLCFTRFLCLYFMNFYEKLTRKHRIIYLIIIYNLITICVHCDKILDNLRHERQMIMTELCFAQAIKKPKLYNQCSDDEIFGKKFPDFWSKFWGTLSNVFHVIVVLKPVIFLFLSIMATSMIMGRIAKQAKFQLQHNRRDFLNSFRISLVMFLQTFLYFFVFVLQFLKFFKDITPFVDFVHVSYDYDYVPAWWCSEGDTICINWPLPTWLHSDLGLIDPAILQTIVQIRIFIESIIVLGIMTGYREAIINFIRFVFNATKNPFEKYIKFRSGFSTTQVSVVSKE